MSDDTTTRQSVLPASHPSSAASGSPVIARQRLLQFSTVAAARSILPLLGVVVILSWVSGSQNPFFLTSANAQNVLAQSAVLGILAVGQTFLVIGGQIDLSVGSLVSLTGVIAARQFAAGWSTPTVVAFALLLGAAVGLLWGLAVAYLDVPPFILTLGGLSVIGSLALVLSNNKPIPVSEGLSSWGFGTLAGIRTPVLFLVTTMVLGALILHFTRFGRATFALGSSRSTAFLAGIPVRRHVVTLFVANSALAAFAGLLMMSRLASGDPRAGTGLELSVIAVVVLGGANLAGGRGTIVGTLAGVLVLGVVSASLTFLQVPGAYQALVSGGILVLAVLATAIAERNSARGGASSWRIALTRSLPRMRREA